MMETQDFLIIGAGIFGITTAIELAKRKYKVSVLNPGAIPHPLAASTDISKVVRMEYGSDIEYMDMVIESIKRWKAWNDLFSDPLYHETGYIVTSSSPMEGNPRSYEWCSFQSLLKKGFKPQRLDPRLLAERFPAFNHKYCIDGFFHAIGGFAESGRAVSTLTKYARQLGVAVHEGQTAEQLINRNGQIDAVQTREGNTFQAGQVIVCAGNHTPYLLPELKPYIKITGHPVFHLKPSRPGLFTPPHFGVFTSDISSTGWYGFPLHPSAQVVKVANHGVGIELHPDHDQRVVTEADMGQLRHFLKRSLPALAGDRVVEARRCCYTDTLDGHFWIDRHPGIKGLTVGSGGSGHGFKMGPVIGQMIADTAEKGSHKWSDRYSWRELKGGTRQEEEARFKGSG